MGKGKVISKIMSAIRKNRSVSDSEIFRTERHRVLLAISIQPAQNMIDEIAAGKEPRRDYYLLKQALDADIIFPDDAKKTFSGRLISRLFDNRTLVAWEAFCRRHKYNAIFSDTEGVGLLLALLLKVSGTSPKKIHHTLIAQYLSPFKKRIFFYLGVGSHLNNVVVHCEAQRVMAINKLHTKSEQILKLPGITDEQFWKPSVTSDNITNEEQTPLICAAGLEGRDYTTLFTAVNDLNVNVHVAADSAYAQHRGFRKRRQRTSANFATIPSNVTVQKCSYAEMRQLYAASRFVIVPLNETDDSAGISVIFEAMAMGKAVIATGTSGQTDVLRDPRANGYGYGPIVRECSLGFLDTQGFADTLGKLPTGFYVKPSDPDDLRDRILYLLDHPEIAEEMGRNGRLLMETYYGVDYFIKRYSAAILGQPQPDCLAYKANVPDVVEASFNE